MIQTNGHVHAGIVQGVAVAAYVVVALFIFRSLVVMFPDNPVTDGLAWLTG